MAAMVPDGQTMQVLDGCDGPEGQTMEPVNQSLAHWAAELLRRLGACDRNGAWDCGQAHAWLSLECLVASGFARRVSTEQARGVWFASSGASAVPVMGGSQGSTTVNFVSSN